MGYLCSCPSIPLPAGCCCHAQGCARTSLLSCCMAAAHHLVRQAASCCHMGVLTTHLAALHPACGGLVTIPLHTAAAPTDPVCDPTGPTDPAADPVALPRRCAAVMLPRPSRAPRWRMEAAERWRRSLMRLSRRTLGQVLDTLAISDARRVSRLKGSCGRGLGGRGEVVTTGGGLTCSGWVDVGQKSGQNGRRRQGGYRWQTVGQVQQAVGQQHCRGGPLQGTY